MPEHEDDAAVPGGWRSALVLALAVLAVAHSVIIALWLAPDGPVRDAAGPGRLSFYVNPYFQQSWDVLEPSAQRVDEALWVRARVRTGPEEVEDTEWIDVTKADADAARLDLTPERMRSASRRLATNLNGVMFDLGNAGRQRVQDSYAGKDVGALQGVLLDEGVAASAVQRYLRLDTMATRFASLYTQASEEQRVVQVQYRIGRRTVPPRNERDDRTIRDEELAWFDVGWRTVDRGSEQAQAAFDDYVRGS
ncbi:DUF5819 family protein [Aeromicrobium sp. CF4.19]|uniref:DUF5819 family protein n=1 Tax=Aeromicrobium sp. CF4.19 TaxID=3373082 RepID=UPI003EE738DD